MSDFCPDCFHLKCLKHSEHGHREVKIGVIELHPDERLRTDFYAITDDLRASGSIVDVWLLDIQSILGKHGYEMRIFTKRPKLWGDSPAAVPQAAQEVDETCRDATTKGDGRVEIRPCVLGRVEH